MLYVVKKYCPEEAQLNRWAKRRLIIKQWPEELIYLLELFHHADDENKMFSKKSTWFHSNVLFLHRSRPGSQRHDRKRAI